MNILLFGGSFNPPHLGHCIVVAQAFELIPDIDEIWLLPTFNHSFGKELAPASHRVAMCNLLIQNLSQTKVSSFEIDRQLTGHTYDTLQALKQSYPEHNFSFLMGSDQLPTFQKWGNWQELLRQMHFYVYPRSGHRHDVTLPNMTLLTSPTQVITNISSTLVRERLKNHLSTAHVLPNNIKEYIDQNQLYHFLGTKP